MVIGMILYSKNGNGQIGDAPTKNGDREEASGGEKAIDYRNLEKEVVVAYKCKHSAPRII